MIMEKGKNYKFKYVDVNGNETNREIITLSEAAEPKNINAYDITELNPLERKHLTDKQTEYNEYVTTFMANMFNFKTWYEHTTDEKFPEHIFKFRKFTVKNITLE